MIPLLIKSRVKMSKSNLFQKTIILRNETLSPLLEKDLIESKFLLVQSQCLAIQTFKRLCNYILRGSNHWWQFIILTTWWWFYKHAEFMSCRNREVFTYSSEEGSAKTGSVPLRTLLKTMRVNLKVQWRPQETQEIWNVCWWKLQAVK